MSSSLYCGIFDAVLQQAVTAVASHCPGAVPEMSDALTNTSGSSVVQFLASSRNQCTVLRHLDAMERLALLLDALHQQFL